MKYIIKTVDNWFVGPSEYEITLVKKRAFIYNIKKEAEEYVKGTNIFGDLKVVKLKK